jgi:hypothetical protein
MRVKGLKLPPPTSTACRRVPRVAWCYLAQYSLRRAAILDSTLWKQSGPAHMQKKRQYSTLCKESFRNENFQVAHCYGRAICFQAFEATSSPT